MERYTDVLGGYERVANLLSTNTVRLTMNCIVERTGTLTGDDEATRSYLKLRNNILYRLSSLGWHLHTICSTHVQHELAFRKAPGTFDLRQAHLVQAFAVDDVLFNTLSLCDYWANFIGFAFIGSGSKKIGWRSLTKAAYDKNNAFSANEVAEDIVEHRKLWAGKLEDLRAEVIHYEAHEGTTSQKMRLGEDKEMHFTVTCNISEKVARKLGLSSKTNDEGVVDAQHGAIEICQNSVDWLAKTTLKACKTLTGDTIKPA